MDATADSADPSPFPPPLSIPQHPSRSVHSGCAAAAMSAWPALTRNSRGDRLLCLLDRGQTGLAVRRQQLLILLCALAALAANTACAARCSQRCSQAVSGQRVRCSVFCGRAHRRWPASSCPPPHSPYSPHSPHSPHSLPAGHSSIPLPGRPGLAGRPVSWSPPTPQPALPKRPRPGCRQPWAPPSWSHQDWSGAAAVLAKRRSEHTSTNTRECSNKMCRHVCIVPLLHSAHPAAEKFSPSPAKLTEVPGLLDRRTPPTRHQHPHSALEFRARETNFGGRDLPQGQLELKLFQPANQCWAAPNKHC